MKTINVALIGCKFMGKAHSHAWRTVARFFDPDAVPVLKVVVLRNDIDSVDIRFSTRIALLGPTGRRPGLEGKPSHAKQKLVDSARSSSSAIRQHSSYPDIGNGQRR